MPNVFLSHSTADREIASRLATDLRGHGVDVWYSPWEIRPGDSLRCKIEEGLASCTHFSVLLTPRSLESVWVQTELDAGLVMQIERLAGLVVLVAGLAHDQIPLLLRGRLYVTLDADYADEILRLSRALHGLAVAKPPLGPAPTPPRLRLPLTPEALLVADALLQAWPDCSTRHGLAGDELRAALPPMPWPRVVEALDELDEEGLLDVGHASGDFASVQPRSALFLAAADSHEGSMVAADATAIAAELAGGDGSAMGHELADRLGWAAARTNLALHWLVGRGGAKEVMQLCDGRPEYAYSLLAITSAGRRLARVESK